MLEYVNFANNDWLVNRSWQNPRHGVHVYCDVGLYSQVGGYNYGGLTLRVFGRRNEVAMSTTTMNSTSFPRFIVLSILLRAQNSWLPFPLPPTDTLFDYQSLVSSSSLLSAV